MIQLTYISEAVGSLDSGDLFKIIEQSAKNNLRDGLTGFLIFSNGRFFQVIEGDEQAVNDLLGRLEKDKRHVSIEMLSSEIIDQRSFPKWNMKRILINPSSELPKDLEAALTNAKPGVRNLVAQFLTNPASSKAA